MMDIWEKLYEAAKNDYNPHYVTPFIYSNHVVAAIEAEDGQIFTGYCFEATSGVFHLCAERAASFNMFQQSGQTTIKRIIAFRDKALIVNLPNQIIKRMPFGKITPLAKASHKIF